MINESQEVLHHLAIELATAKVNSWYSVKLGDTSKSEKYRQLLLGLKIAIRALLGVPVKTRVRTHEEDIEFWGAPREIFCEVSIGEYTVNIGIEPIR